MTALGDGRANPMFVGGSAAVMGPDGNIVRQICAASTVIQLLHATNGLDPNPILLGAACDRRKGLAEAWTG